MLKERSVAQDFLTEAFIRLRQKLKLISGRVLADPEGAEDVLQDSFVRLWRKRYPLRSEQEAEALLTRTVRNASLNERRRKRPQPLETDLPDERPDPDELKQKIDSELTQLQKYILEEKEYGGRTLEEIARELGMEAAAVRMQLSRARKTLRNALKDDR